MTNKEKYESFCQNTYVPIWSKPWWMDAACGPENWDVWLYELGDAVLAAMPYYMEQRGSYRYITKAMQTQNNGLIFREDSTRKRASEGEFQEKIIHAACAFIDSLGLDVYEQQYHHSFQNWSPFFWHNFTSILRYTYVIEDTSDLDAVFGEFTANYRKNIRKGQKLTKVIENMSADSFYEKYVEIYERQGLPAGVSRDYWERVYTACMEHNCGKTMYAADEDGNIHSIMFVLWDERAMYPLFGGYMNEYSTSQSYAALTYHSICLAHEKGLAYDFEGSMIQRIAKSFRQFGGTPKPYYRIRKVYNPEIVRKEAEEYIARLAKEREEKEGT